MASSRKPLLFGRGSLGTYLLVCCVRGEQVRGLRRTLIYHRCNEPVSPLCHGFDEHRFIGPVSKDFSDVQNVLSENFWVDVGLGPQGFQKLVLGDEPSRVFHQKPEDVVGFRGDWHAFFSAPKAMVCRVKPE